MQYCKRLIIFNLLLTFSFQLAAQSVKDADITGLWKGTMYNDTTQLYYRYEIAISEKKGKYFGYSHTYFILNDKEYHGVKKIKIKRKDDEIITQDVELIANNYPVKPPKGVHVKNILKFEFRDKIMTLSGDFATNRTKEYAPATGFIQVERKNDFRQSALVPHLEELGLAQELSFVQEEKIKETKSIVKAGTVTGQPVVTTIAAKEKPVTVNEQQPDETKIVTIQPAGKKEEEKRIAKNQPVKKPGEAKPDPIIKDKPVIKTAVKAQEAAVVKTVKEKEVEKPAVEKITKTVRSEPVKTNAVEKAAVDIVNRTIETIESVDYTSDSLVLTLYDNGEVDGDTVSVLMNGEVIMPKVGLSTNAVRKVIYTKDLPESIQIVMYAETLGSLPPNTGLLIVNDGKMRYEIRFSGDLKKNAAIVFRRKEK